MVDAAHPYVVVPIGVGLGRLGRREEEVVVDHRHVLAEQFAHQGERAWVPQQAQQPLVVFDGGLDLVEGLAADAGSVGVGTPLGFGLVGGLADLLEFRLGEGFGEDEVAVPFEGGSLVGGHGSESTGAYEVVALGLLTGLTFVGLVVQVLNAGLVPLESG